MSEQDKVIQELEAKIATLTKELASIRKSKDSLWHSIYGKCRELKVTDRYSKAIANYFSEVVVQWATDQRAKVEPRYNSDYPPDFVDCLNDLITAVQTPDPDAFFKRLDPVHRNYPEIESAREEVDPGPISSSEQSGAEFSEKFNSFSRRVNVPKPFNKVNQ